jgi:serine/threonine protein kinase
VPRDAAPVFIQSNPIRTGHPIVADFKTALKALARGDLEFDVVATNLSKMLLKQPQIALTIMEQLRAAYSEDLIDASIYARLKRLVTESPDGTDDATRFLADKTEIVSREDRTSFTDETDSSAIAAQARAAISAAMGTDNTLDFDLMGDSSPSEGSWPVGDSKSNAIGSGRNTPVKEEKITSGSVLKDRFQLDDVLGIGGMGTVYRGRDLIKVEARDKNPFVALKVLNEDFKQHPDSFIALQREASRQQRLAHPNIATVYDFDRTRGGTVFLTMELLEGDPLNNIIKKQVRVKGGLPFDEALTMIKGLGNALIYAHERGIVHSDFKPGNCFQTNDGVMKVLDFGIARAVKNPLQGDGEKTLFDAAKLGALTPAYASAEMLEGEEPDPRDDLYALACVAYELLTGKHPFNKLPANSARDNNLVPNPIKGLKRRQHKGLMRGLAFAREDRSQSVEQFLIELEGNTSPFKNPFVLVPAALVIIGLVAAAPTLDFIHEKAISEKIAAIKSLDSGIVETTLKELHKPEFDPADRDRILVATRTEMLTYFQNEIELKVDVDAERYNFRGAEAVIDRVAMMEVFKDSAQVQQWRERIINAESVLLNDQTVIFNEALAANRLLPLDGSDDVHDALGIVAKVSPDVFAQFKQRLPGQYAAAIERAIVNEEFELANALGEVGLELSTGNKNLNNLLAKIEGAQERAEAARKILEFTARIQDAVDNSDRLAGYARVQQDVRELSEIDPASELLASLARKVGPLVDKDIAALSENKNWGSSDLVQNDYSDLLLPLGMRDKHARATKLRAEFEIEIDKLVMEIGAAVAADNLALPAPKNATGLVAKLDAMAPGHLRTEQAREIVARGYLGKARTARAKSDFSNAEKYLTAGSEIAAGTDVIASLEIEKGITVADAAANAAALLQRLANRETAFEQAWTSAEQSFGSLGADTSSISFALARYDALVSLKPNDERLPKLRDQLVSSVTRVANQLAAKEQWSDAVNVTRATLAYAPGLPVLSENLMAFEAQQRDAQLEVQRRYLVDRKLAVETLLANATADRPWSIAIRKDMAEIQYLAASNDPWVGEFKVKIATVFVTKATRAREDERFAEGKNMLDRAQRYAPELPALTSERFALATATNTFELEQREQEQVALIEGLKQDFETQAKANDVSGAARTLAEIQRYLGPNDSFVTVTGPEFLADAYYKLAITKAEQQDFAAALKLAKAGLKLRPQSQELRLAVKDYTVDGNRQELKKTFGSSADFDLNDALEKISEVQILDPRAYGVAESEWAEAVTIRLRTLQKAEGDRSNPLVDRAKEVFPGNVLIASLDYVGPLVADAPPSVAKIKSAIDAALLTQAKDLIKSVSAEDARHGSIIELKSLYNSKIQSAKSLYDGYKSAFSGKDYSAANSIIDKALNLWGDSTTFKREKTRVLAALNQTSPIGSNGNINDGPAPQSKSPCTSKLAGHGKRKLGTCFDMVSLSARGPLMVVVPDDAEFPQSFAIGKYEVTVGDFNQYCKMSAVCSEISDRESRLPVSGISLEQASAYATWLSERTGNVYRLPTVSEWTYAAQANGEQPRKDYNCRVEQSGQILKGQSTMRIDTGKANGWGLYNYVGNVQEWARTPSGVVARGGAFEDTFSKCAISLEKPHGGAPDKSTGFRLLQELD